MTDSNDKLDTETGVDATAETPGVAALQADIARTREELAETVDLLAAKLDAKGRVRDQVNGRIVTTRERAAHRLRSIRDRSTGPDGRPTPAALTVVGGVVGIAAAALLARAGLAARGRRRMRFRGL